MTAPAPSLTGVLETALYVLDLDRSVAFYRETMGLQVLARDARFAALDVAGRQVLLLFRKGASVDPVRTSGGTIPGHGGDGKLHLAFAAPAESLEGWERRLEERGVAVTSRVRWSRGGRSLYFEDPDGNVLELAAPGVWETY